MKQVRNQYTGAAGITAREATQLKSMFTKLDKIYKKPNLWILHKRKVAQAMDLVYQILEDSERI